MKLINMLKLKTNFYELNFPESTPLRHIKMFNIKPILFYFSPSLKISSKFPRNIQILK